MNQIIKLTQEQLNTMSEESKNLFYSVLTETQHNQIINLFNSYGTIKETYYKRDYTVCGEYGIALHIILNNNINNIEELNSNLYKLLNHRGEAYINTDNITASSIDSAYTGVIIDNPINLNDSIEYIIYGNYDPEGNDMF